MNTDTGREGRHRADINGSTGTRSWDEIEEWSRESSGERRGFRWSALKEPRVLLGILTAGALALGGAHMATSMTPREDTVAVNEEAPPGPPHSTSSPRDFASAAPTASSPPAIVGGAAQPVASPEAPHTILVHVVGAVKDPRVVELPADSRVGEALEAAGGATDEADLSRLNLARVVSDGEQVFVPRQGEDIPAGLPAPSPQQGAIPGDSTGENPSDHGLLNINTATESELEELPGVGPAIASRIVEHRTTNGAFTSIEQLQDVKGIGPAIFEKLRERITV